ncbi:MAG: TrmB family transcriptional regulator [Planctomycetota bacterium]|jgi:sugar-specific transcriptional regulator TrmB
MAGEDVCVALVADLGLTELEAQVYVFLLQHSPATGYKIAKGIGRSFPSTYQGLASLEGKGAILVDDGENRLSRAVPLEEFMDQLEARFRERRRLIKAAVRRLPQCSSDTRIYQLASVDQVYERSRRMLAECEERALVELFPGPLEVLGAAVEENAARGIDVTARLYESAPLDGVRLIRSPYGSQTVHSFGSDWLALFIDGRQFLLANLVAGGDGVINAVWSANPTVARVLYDHANSDFHHYAFRSSLYANESVDELRAEYERLREIFPPGGDLGFKDMMDRVTSAGQGGPAEMDQERRSSASGQRSMLTPGHGNNEEKGA